MVDRYLKGACLGFSSTIKQINRFVVFTSQAQYTHTHSHTPQVLGFEYQSTTSFSIVVEKDACAAVGCGVHGVCDSGVCICDPLWTGARCEVPDCPGEPDCLARGECVANTTDIGGGGGGDGGPQPVRRQRRRVLSSSNSEGDEPGGRGRGRELASEDEDAPHCVCSFGFVGEDCSALSPNFESPLETLPPGQGTAGLLNSDENGTIIETAGAGNWSYFRIDIPANASDGKVSLYITAEQVQRENVREEGAECEAAIGEAGGAGGCGRGDLAVGVHT